MGVLPGPFRYAAAQAVVRAQLGRMLTSSQWDDLLTASDPADFVRRLERTPHREALGRMDPRRTETSRVARELRGSLARAAHAPLKLLQGNARQLAEWLWSRYELSNVKTLVRLVASRAPAQAVQENLIPLGSTSPLPWDRLCQSRSVGEIVAHLRTSPRGGLYATALAQASKRYERERGVFVLEVSLDLAYYRRLFARARSLAGRERKEAVRFIGTILDAKNLTWASRYRLEFELRTEEILSFTLHRGARVTPAVLREVARGVSPIGIALSLWGERLPDAEGLRQRDPREALPDLELALDRYLHREAGAALRGYPFHIGFVLAHQIVQQSESSDLITLIEGKAARWPVEKIRARWIREVEDRSYG